MLRIVVIGMPLSGKTSVYRRLSKKIEGGVDCPKFDANGSNSTSDMCTQSRVVHPESGLASMLNLYELDAEIETNAGKSISEIFSEEGEAGFRVKERKTLQRLLGFQEMEATEEGTKEHISIVFAGGGVVQTPETRALLIQFDGIVYLRASLSTLLRRLNEAEAKKRPLFQADRPEESLARLYRVRTKYYSELATDIIDTDGLGIAEVSDLLMERLKNILRRKYEGSRCGSERTQLSDSGRPNDQGDRGTQISRCH